jgi:hypothetical protein
VPQFLHPSPISGSTSRAPTKDLPMAPNEQPDPNRRALVFGLPALTLAAGFAPAHAADPIGRAVEIVGEVAVERSGAVEGLGPEGAILLDDLVRTGRSSFAALALGDATLVRLGSDVNLLIDSFLADGGGVLDIGAGPILFDRDEAAPPVDLTVRTAFGLIGVRGTKFFAGPSNDVFGIFVERGSIRVLAGGEGVRLQAGEGVDIPAQGAPPDPVRPWGAPRIEAAYRSVGIE